jgi:RNA polymerase sigma factor (sigma-70 family)
MSADGNVTSIYWESFLKGNKEAFAYFYNLHVNSIYRYGTKICKDENLVKDAVQEIFLDLYLKREKNKTNPDNLRFYLILALKHNLIKKITRYRKMANEDYCLLKFEPEYSIETTIIKDETEAEMSRKVQEMLSILPARQKEAVYLRFNEEMDYPEIAQVLNISVESVRKQVYRAIKAIRQKYVSQPIILFSLLVRLLK